MIISVLIDNPDNTTHADADTDITYLLNLRSIYTKYSYKLFTTDPRKYSIPYIDNIIELWDMINSTKHDTPREFIHVGDPSGIIDTPFYQRVYSLKKLDMYSFIEHTISDIDNTNDVILYRYDRHNKYEYKLLDLLRNIINNGERRIDRTGTGTLSLFGPQLEIDISNQFPLMTTRTMSLRMIFEELMLFIRGQTNSKILEARNVNVWSGNTTREFLDSRGLYHYKEGDMGPTYGFMFRHAGADYQGCDKDYTHQGYDQLSQAIHLIRTNPYSRRIIINLWDSSKLDQMALPPCGFNYQFYVSDPDGSKLLSCKITQRSSDISLAGGWNIASGALLTYMIARMTGTLPHKLIWSVGDVHIYNNQIQSVVEQLERKPYPLPFMLFSEDAPSMVNGKHITEFDYSKHIRLIGYEHQKSIRFSMNV
jgi:thymidylate synthase